MDVHQILRLGQAVTTYYKRAEVEPELNEGLEKYMQQNLASEDLGLWQQWGNKQLQPIENASPVSLPPAV